MKILFGNEIIPLVEKKSEFLESIELMEELNSETIICKDFSADIIDLACQLGFFPMANSINNQWLLYLKHHKQRCVMVPGDIHVEKKMKKISKRFYLTINENFEKCADMINQTYEDSWLCEALVQSYMTILKNKSYSTKFYSFELWQDQEMVAGELGYLVGGTYTSLSGFHKVNHSGKVQMCSTAELLIQYGIELWDLGMELPYKLDLGATVISKLEFLDKMLKLRKKKISVNKVNKNAYDIIYSHLD